MSKSKHGPALFEVYTKGQIGEATRDLDDSSSAMRRTPVGKSASAFRSTLTSLAKTIGGAGRASEELAPRTVRPATAVGLDEGRLHVALSSRGAGLVAFGLLLLLCVAFAMGQWFGRQGGLADGRKQAQDSLQREAEDEIAAARESQPVDNLFAGIGASPVAADATVTGVSATPIPQPPVSLTARQAQRPATEWLKGHTYIVVQSFSSDARQDAVRAQAYLAQYGVDTEIFGSSDRGYRLITTKGYNRKNATQRELSDRFLEKIGTIGKAYFKSGGRYELEGYLATLRTDSW